MKYKTQKGITLVALVITIIVLLILAGVAINMAINSDGLFGKAKESTTKWNIAVQAEQNAIENILLQANEISGAATKQGSIELNKTSLTLEIVDGANAEETLEATLKNIEGEVNWTSSDSEVATVDSNGKVTTVGAGETTITATCGTYTATCKVTVEAKTTPTIAFTIDGKTYYSQEGWDWATWCMEIMYNEEGFVIDGTDIRKATGSSMVLGSMGAAGAMARISSSEEIESGGEYSWVDTLEPWPY